MAARGSIESSGSESLQGLSPFKSQVWWDKKSPETHMNGISWSLFIILMVAAVVSAIFMDERGITDGIIFAVVVPVMLLAFYLLFAIQVARQWEKAVVLRFGKMHGLKGPGLFWIIPIVDTVTTWIDHRVMVTPFSAEKTLTTRHSPGECRRGALLGGVGRRKSSPGS